MSSAGEELAVNGVTADVIGAIYDVATDPDGWQSLLGRLCDLQRGNAALLGWHNPVTHAMRIRKAANVAPAYLRSYAEHFGAGDRWSAKARDAFRPGMIWTEDVEAAAEDEDDGAFYRDWLLPQGISYLLRAVVARGDPLNSGDPGVTWIAIGRDSDAGPYGDPDCEVLESLLPHLRRVLEIQSTVDSLRARCRTTMSTFDHLPIGVVLLDRQRRVVVMNRKAREIAKQDGEATDIIQSMLRNGGGPRLVAMTDGKDDQGSGKLIDRAGDTSWYCTLSRRPLIAIMRRLQTGSADVGAHEPVAALFLSDPDDEAQIDDVMVRRLYGLTPAEARLAILLAQGHHLDEVAEILKISIHTARTHLKRVLGKTQTARQADLVRLLLNPCTQLRM